MPDRFIPIAKPYLDDREVEAAGRVIRSGWVTQGPEVAAFEGEFAAYARTAHACAVSSGTTALHLALATLGVGPGDEVITVSHSFIATANSIRHCRATPVFVDIDPKTFNLDPAHLESALSERTRAILCVHQMGMPCDLAAILKIADRRSIPVVEDAACALGTEILWDKSWEPIGRPRAAMACFSFHPRKAITTGDGGMITTSKPDWDQKLRLLRHHGMSVSDAVRHRSREVIFETYPILGYNYRMTDIQAAIGREQLKRLPQIVERRRFLAQRYHGLLSAIPGIVTPTEPAWGRSNWQSYCVRLPPGTDQRGVMQILLDAGIATRRGVMCAHREAAYGPGTWSCGTSNGGCDCGPAGCQRLRKSEEAQDHTVLLPIFHEMTEADQEAVVAALRDACR